MNFQQAHRAQPSRVFQGHKQTTSRKKPLSKNTWQLPYVTERIKSTKSHREGHRASNGAPTLCFLFIGKVRHMLQQGAKSQLARLDGNRIAVPDRGFLIKPIARHGFSFRPRRNHGPAVFSPDRTIQERSMTLILGGSGASRAEAWREQRSDHQNTGGKITEFIYIRNTEYEQSLAIAITDRCGRSAVRGKDKRLCASKGKVGIGTSLRDAKLQGCPHQSDDDV